MRRHLTGYAVVFNLRHNRPAGHLFQNRYKSIFCDKDPYLLEWVLNTSTLDQNSHGMSLVELVQRVSDYFRIAPSALSDPSKERNMVCAKAVICHVAVRKLGIKGLDVAVMLGYSSTAVTHAAKRGQKLLSCDGELQQLLEAWETLNIRNDPNATSF